MDTEKGPDGCKLSRKSRAAFINLSFPHLLQRRPLQLSQEYSAGKALPVCLPPPEPLQRVPSQEHTKEPFTFPFSSFRRKETGCPCRFPELVVSGVLMSVWASTQMTHRSGWILAWPEMLPTAILGRKRMCVNIKFVTSSHTSGR